MTPKPPSPDDPQYAAMVAFMPRLGVKTYQIRYQDDLKPVVWVADAKLVDSVGRKGHEAAGALSPIKATERLIEQIVDGARCRHCRKLTSFTLDHRIMPLADFVCYYQYDPETKSIRRGCE